MMQFKRGHRLHESHTCYRNIRTISTLLLAVFLFIAPLCESSIALRLHTEHRLAKGLNQENELLSEKFFRSILNIGESSYTEVRYKRYKDTKAAAISSIPLVDAAENHSHICLL